MTMGKVKEAAGLIRAVRNAGTFSSERRCSLCNLYYLCNVKCVMCNVLQMILIKTTKKWGLTVTRHFNNGCQVSTVLWQFAPVQYNL